MKKRILMIIVLLLVGLASVALATEFQDCRILARERIGPDDWRIIFNFDPIQGGQLKAEGKLGPSLDAKWGEMPVSIVNFQGHARGQMILDGFPEHSTAYFTYYTVLDGVRRSIDPMCSEFRYPLNAPPEKTYLGVPLEEKYVTGFIPPAIGYLLSKKDKDPQPPPPPPVVHQCPILGVDLKYENGIKVHYVKVSLQRFTGATPEILALATPYVDRQSAPGAAWTGFYAVERQGDVAIIRVVNWPGGIMEFSIKLMFGPTPFWQDLTSWSDTCGFNYVTEGHLWTMFF